MRNEDEFQRVLERLNDLKIMRGAVEGYRNQLAAFADQALGEIRILQALINDALLNDASKVAVQIRLATNPPP